MLDNLIKYVASMTSRIPVVNNAWHWPPDMIQDISNSHLKKCVCAYRRKEGRNDYICSSHLGLIRDDG